jgi:hypothetical protein
MVLEMLINPIAGLLDKFIPDADEKARLAHEIATLAERQAHEIAKAQIAVNNTEAAHKSLFVAGWRPATGWICASGLGFNYIVVPLGNFYLAVSGNTIVIPSLDLSEMLPVLMGMLGLGAYRTYEKTKKVARES